MIWRLFGSAEEVQESLLSDRHSGLYNFGNTCYCNSVLQSLYFCKPFRDRIFTTGNQNAEIMKRLRQSVESQEEGSRVSSQIAEEKLTVDTVTDNNQHSILSPQGLMNLVKPLTFGQSSLQITGNSLTLLSTLKDLFVLIHNSKTSVSSTPSPVTTSPPQQLSDNQGSTSINGKSLQVPQSSHKRNKSSGSFKTKSVSPKDFIQQLRQENEQFRAPIHHDAHEFFNFLINNISETLNTTNTNLNDLSKIMQQRNSADQELIELQKLRHQKEQQPEDSKQQQSNTWIQQLFQGQLSNETKCMTCERVTTRTETFLDLSLEIPENHTSLTYALKNFTAPEYMTGQNKFWCDSCNSLQEAQKRMLIKQTPRILCICLKRFKYNEQIGGFVKLQHRVSFPLQLRLSHAMSTSNKNSSDQLYQLFSVVVHLGSGANHGHYISVVRSGGRWWVYDDTIVESVDEEFLACLFGSGHETYSCTQDQEEYSKANSISEGYGFIHSLPKTESQINQQTNSSQSKPQEQERTSLTGKLMSGWSSTSKKLSTGASSLPHGTAYMLFYEAVNEL